MSELDKLHARWNMYMMVFLGAGVFGTIAMLYITQQLPTFELMRSVFMQWIIK